MLFTNALEGLGVYAMHSLPLMTTGTIRYVGSAHEMADDSPAHGSQTRPYGTLDYAISKTAAGKGDVLLVMPGHVETVTAAGGLDLDVAGLSIIGLGRGTYQPKIVVGTAATADIDIDAASIYLENINIVANFADIEVLFDVNATDFTLMRCRFSQAAVNLNALICVQDAAAAGSDRIKIIGCEASMYDAANTHFVNFAGTGDGHVVAHNNLLGDWGTMCVGGAGVVTRASILHNTIFNAATDADVCISMAATATGLCAYNACTGGHASQGIIPGDLGAIENYYEGHTSDLSGVLEPANA